jgi:1-acyl-sn-glycerol-3-phosphate acyltransferase
LNFLRALFRFIALTIWALIISLAILISLSIAFIVGRRDKARRKVAHKFFNIFLRGVHILSGLRIHWHGAPPRDPHVMMANHRSYVDAVVLPVSFPVVFVARHETKYWPVVGWGATILGTIWVKRDCKESRTATRTAVKERLKEGYGVVIFPEGKTAVGPELLPYKKGMFYTCAEHGFPIAPAAIEFEDKGVAWASDEWFIPHSFRNFGKRRINVHVSFGPSFSGNEAEKLREDVMNWTQEECYRLRAILDKV